MQSGLYEPGSSRGLLVFLNKTSRARFHTVGKFPSARHCVKIFARHAGRDFASSLTASPGMLSGQGALLVGILLASSDTSETVTASTVSSSGQSVRARGGVVKEEPGDDCVHPPGCPYPGNRFPHAEPPHDQPVKLPPRVSIHCRA